MHFNADEYLAALEPPSVTINGRLYTGRLLSFNEWLREADALQRWQSGKASSEEIARMAARLLLLLFPKPWWKFWEPSVASLMLQWPPHLWQKAVVGFINSQMEMVLKSAATIREPVTAEPPPPTES